MPFIFLPTGETRCPKLGEFFLNRGMDWVRRACFDYEGENEFPIYDRVEVPALLIEKLRKEARE